MRTYKLPTGHWIDLDHILAVHPIDEYMDHIDSCVIRIEFAFRDEPLNFDYYKLIMQLHPFNTLGKEDFLVTHYNKLSEEEEQKMKAAKIVKDEANAIRKVHLQNFHDQIIRTWRGQ